MKNKTKRRLIKKNKANSFLIKKFIFENYNGDLDKTVPIIEKYKGVIASAIRFCELEELREFSYIEYGRVFSRRELRERKKEEIKWGFDSRTGNETYGYESEESIKNNLSYISDRSHCTFRLRWMLEIPENFAKLRNLPK